VKHPQISKQDEHCETMGGGLRGLELELPQQRPASVAQATLHERAQTSSIHSDAAWLLHIYNRDRRRADRSTSEL
jgi:hypothetical protein